MAVVTVFYGPVPLGGPYAVWLQVNGVCTRCKPDLPTLALARITANQWAIRELADFVQFDCTDESDDAILSVSQSVVG